MYREGNATTIINNCTYMYIGEMDFRTCDHISKRANLPLEDILYMPIGKSIIFRRGQNPIFASRYKITDNLLYRKLTKKYESKKQEPEQVKKLNLNTVLHRFELEQPLRRKDSSMDNLQAELESKFDELFVTNHSNADALINKCTLKLSLLIDCLTYFRLLFR